MYPSPCTSGVGVLSPCTSGVGVFSPCTRVVWSLARVPGWCGPWPVYPPYPIPRVPPTHPTTVPHPRSRTRTTVPSWEMSVLTKLTPTGCWDKRLSVVSRALTIHAGLTVTVQAGMKPLAREAILVRNVKTAESRVFQCFDEKC